MDAISLRLESLKKLFQRLEFRKINSFHIAKVYVLCYITLVDKKLWQVLGYETRKILFLLQQIIKIQI